MIAALVEPPRPKPIGRSGARRWRRIVDYLTAAGNARGLLLPRALVARPKGRPAAKAPEFSALHLRVSRQFSLRRRRVYESYSIMMRGRSGKAADIGAVTLISLEAL